MKKINIPDKGTVVIDKIQLRKGEDFFYVPFTDSIERYENVDYGEFDPSKMGWEKVIASSFFLDKDIPMYKEEDDVEELALEEYNRRTVMIPVPTSIWLSKKDEYIEWYKTGYKAAQSKGCYTEEDLRKAYEQGWDDVHPKTECGLKNWMYATEEEIQNWRYQQFLKDKPVEFEMEDKIAMDGHTIIGLEIKTTRDENGQLWYKLK